MKTGVRLTEFYDKKIAPYSHMEDLFKEAFRQEFEDLNKEAFRNTGDLGYLASAVVLSSDTDDTFDVDTNVVGFDGVGNLINAASAAYGNNIAFENALGITYYVAAKFVTYEDTVVANPRTGSPYYDSIMTTIGEKSNPTSVVVAGPGLAINVNSITEAGVDHSGRTVRVWLTDNANFRNNGSDQAAVAFETLTISYGGGNNTVTTAGHLGQATPSIVAGDYQVMVEGVTWRRNTNLSSVAGYIYLGTITGTGSPSQPTAFNTTGQRIWPGIISYGVDTFNTLRSDGMLSGGATTDGGALVADVAAYSMFSRGNTYTTVGVTNVTCTDAATNYIFFDPADLTLKSTTTVGDTFVEGAVQVSRVVCAGGVITDIRDTRRYINHIDDKVIATVGPASVRAHFASLQEAIDFFDVNDATSRNLSEIWLIGPTTLTAAATLRRSGITIRGMRDGQTELSWSHDGPAIDLAGFDDVTVENVQFHFTGGATASNDAACVIASGTQSDRITLRGCYLIDDSSTLRGYVYSDVAAGADDWLIENNIASTLNYAVYIDSCLNIRILNNIFVQNGGAQGAGINSGIYMINGANAGQIIGNRVEDHNDGINGQGDGAVIIHNRIITVDDDGIYWSGDDKTVIANNHVDTAGDKGIYGDGVGVVSGNVVDNVTGNGIELDNTDTMTCYGNVVTTAGGIGIAVTVGGTRNGTCIVGNTVRGSTGDGINFDGNNIDDPALMIGNIVRGIGGTGDGISVTQAPQAVVANNAVEQNTNGRGIIASATATDIKVSGNRIENMNGANGDAIQIGATGAHVTDNYLKDVAQIGIELLAAATRCHVSGNTLNNVDGDGITVAGNACLIGNNRLYDIVGTNAAIYVNGATDTMIESNHIELVTAGHCIELAGVCSDSKVDGNMMRDMNDATGNMNAIEVGGASVNLVISNNHFDDMATSGLFINVGDSGATGAVISGNKCEMSGSGGGIHIEAGDFAITGNNIVDTDDFGIEVEQTAATSVSSGSITGNRVKGQNDGIKIQNSHGSVMSDVVISGNNIEAVDQHGVFLYPSVANAIIRGVAVLANHIQTASNDGVYFDATSATQRCEQCTIMGNHIQAKGAGGGDYAWEIDTACDNCGYTANFLNGLAVLDNGTATHVGADI